ncbi:hypothetical protein [Aneurinibacillus sp. UBA3580]|jgi:hypothetical protein|uniref:hypothetical protein n=1 Tax=Aneurinibacillus sp. UBA3580 TaxID=1946041 RepID=UPI00257AA8F1|nr:hypothetical protein [Aneurinibacillus sp. UBA3580]
MRDEYFEMRERTADLSPQLKWMIEQELRQKELERRQQQYERRLDMIQQQAHELRDSIAETREVMEVIRSEKWRERMNTMVRQIAGKAFNRDHSACRRELYKELERRAHCDVTRRLMNYKERLKQNGYTKTAVDKTNMLDVIEMDDRLREIFTLIVKEAYIKYCG